MKTIFGFLLIIACTTQTMAQVDPHFSQYYANPLWLNPALTGVINADARINANYKNQWAGINNAYETAAISADFRPTDKIGLGLSILNQSAGGDTYNIFTGYASASYGIALSSNGNHRLSFGLQAGLINRSFDINGLEFGNQFIPGMGYDPATSNMEAFAGTSMTVFDANAGIYYYDNSPDKRLNLFAGFSAGHLSMPRDPFASSESGSIPVRYAMHAGVRIRINELYDITPNGLLIRQQEASIKGLGAHSEFKFPNNNGLILGGLYRFGDAAIANIGYRYNNLLAGASYDFNTSTLRRATDGQGGIELSVSYLIGKRQRENDPVSPRF